MGISKLTGTPWHIEYDYPRSQNKDYLESLIQERTPPSNSAKRYFNKYIKQNTKLSDFISNESACINCNKNIYMLNYSKSFVICLKCGTRYKITKKSNTKNVSIYNESVFNKAKVNWKF